MEEWITQFEYDISQTAEVYDTTKERIKRTLIKKWKEDLKEENKSDKDSEFNVDDLHIITRAFGEDD